METTRTRTAYKNIYLNQRTRRYDVKYNFTVRDPVTGAARYRAKWVYGLPTLQAAQTELARLRLSGNVSASSQATFLDALALWNIRAQAQRYSVTTVRNTERYLNMLSRFLPMDTRLADVDEALYYRLFADCRAYGYSEETVYTLHATFRKLYEIAWKRGLIEDNVLRRADAIRTQRLPRCRLVSEEEWRRMDAYLADGGRPRLRLLYNVLYYTGVRIGECLALTWRDFGGPGGLNVDKALLPSGEVKEPKNHKSRVIPLADAARELYRREPSGCAEERVFPYSQRYCAGRLRETCGALGLQPCRCHDFRHTFISNLIRRGVPIPVVEAVSGDSQQTIFQRYSHMFEDDRARMLEVFA